MGLGFSLWLFGLSFSGGMDEDYVYDNFFVRFSLWYMYLYAMHCGGPSIESVYFVFKVGERQNLGVYRGPSTLIRH